MKRGRREWLLAILLGAAVVVWLGNLVGERRDAPDTGIAVADPVRYEVHKADWTRTGPDGTPRFRVRADSLKMHASERVAITEPRVQGLGEHEVWALSAPLGEVPADSGTLRLSDGVAMQGSWPDGEQLTGSTRELIVLLDQRELYSETAVELLGAGRRMRGIGMRADTAGERVRLLDQVRVEYDDAR